MQKAFGKQANPLRKEPPANYAMQFANIFHSWPGFETGSIQAIPCPERWLYHFGPKPKPKPRPMRNQ